MAMQPLPDVATEYAAKQRAENAAAVTEAMRLWRRMSDDFNASFVRIAPELLEVTNVAQERVSANAQAFIPEILTATGQSRADVPRFTVATDVFVGTAGDGLPTESLLWGSVTTVKQAVTAGASPLEALKRGGEYLSLAMGTLLSDTSRGMEGFESFARPVTGWVRQLTPPSCGRCIVLAGKWFRYNKGFQRHPGCDCRHIPASENVAGDFTTGPGAYLNSLSKDELAKALGSKANAEAWDNYGASATQLINAYRSGGNIRTAQVYGRTVRYSMEGVSRRGVAYAQMSRVYELSSMGQVKDGRYRRLVAPRLMPESIFQIAPTRERAQQMLIDYGWLGFTRRTRLNR